MKTRMSSKGQVVIPQWARDYLHLVQGTELEVEVHKNQLVLKKIKGRGRSWRDWEGRFKGVDLTGALEDEHRAEIERDEKSS